MKRSNSSLSASTTRSKRSSANTLARTWLSCATAESSTPTSLACWAQRTAQDFSIPTTRASIVSPRPEPVSARSSPSTRRHIFAGPVSRSGSTVSDVPAADAFDASRTGDLLAYLDASPSPWHAVASTVSRLHAAGFVEADERAAWAPIERGYVRRGGALVAWRQSDTAAAGAPFRIVGAHTDSPCL